MINKWFFNDDHNTNGEMLLWNTIKPHVNVMFDVGCKTDIYYLDNVSNFVNFHLFEPYPVFYDIVKSKLDIIDKKNVFLNNIGIGSNSGKLDYFSKAESFVNRFNELPSKSLPIISLQNYVIDNNIKHIDFIKIDTEGFEFDVLKGAGSFIHNITHIQFEYGGTYPDRGVKLADVYDLLLPHFHIFLIGFDGLYRRNVPIEHAHYSNYFATKDINAVSSIIQENL